MKQINPYSWKIFAVIYSILLIKGMILINLTLPNEMILQQRLGLNLVAFSFLFSIFGFGTYMHYLSIKDTALRFFWARKKKGYK